MRHLKSIINYLMKDEWSFGDSIAFLVSLGVLYFVCISLFHTVTDGLLLKKDAPFLVFDREYFPILKNYIVDIITVHLVGGVLSVVLFPFFFKKSAQSMLRFISINFVFLYVMFFSSIVITFALFNIQYLDGYVPIKYTGTLYSFFAYAASAVFFSCVLIISYRAQGVVFALPRSSKVVRAVKCATLTIVFSYGLHLLVSQSSFIVEKYISPFDKEGFINHYKSNSPFILNRSKL